MEKKIKYSPFRIAVKYLEYFFRAQNGRGHGIHSPFVFDFVVNVLNDDRNYYAYADVEYLRNQLLQDHSLIAVEDLGAGATGTAPVKRKISGIAKQMAKPPRYARLLFRMINHYAPRSILELGTSLGLTTAYLAHAGAPVITLEGSPSIAARALQNFDLLNLKNIRLLEGNFDTLLPRLLDAIEMPEFVFIDGNHRYEPTCRYFNLLVERATPATILVFDDIHWSREMEAAWQQIKAHPSVTLTIDLFLIGIVFFRKEFKEHQDFIIRF